MDTEPLHCLRQRYLVGDPHPSEGTTLPERLRIWRSDPNQRWAPPYRWLLQPVDVVSFGLVHFLLGAVFGYLLDNALFGRACPDERHGRGLLLVKIVVQLGLIILCFNYTRKGLLLLKPKWGHPTYEHDPVPAMDGGFAMSLGFAWTQQNLIERLRLLWRDDEASRT